MKLLIATPAFSGQLTTDYVGSLLNTLRWCAEQKIETEVYFLKNESLISRARNNCASYFLSRDHDKLLFVDADQAWLPADLSKLLSSEHTLVGGTYCKKTLPWDINFTPLPEHEHYFPGGAKSPESFLEYAELAKDTGGEIAVRHLPTGFMLISRTVLETMRGRTPSYLAKDNQHAEEKRHWDFFPAGVLSGQYESEDWFFCSEAAAAGHPPYLNTRVIVDHLGQFNYRISPSMRPPAI